MLKWFKWFGGVNRRLRITVLTEGGIDSVETEIERLFTIIHLRGGWRIRVTKVRD